MSSALGESDYRAGGLERLAECGVLLKKECFAGAVYLAGRAVESMLRAVIWKNDPDIRQGKKSLETGHDLRELLALVADLGVLRSEAHRDRLVADVQHIGRLWLNNMRFFPIGKLNTFWRTIGEIRSQRTIKQAAYDYYGVCFSVVKRCEALCQG